MLPEEKRIPHPLLIAPCQAGETKKGTDESVPLWRKSFDYGSSVRVLLFSVVVPVIEGVTLPVNVVFSRSTTLST